MKLILALGWLERPSQDASQLAATILLLALAIVALLLGGLAIVMLGEPRDNLMGPTRLTLLKRLIPPKEDSSHDLRV